MLSETQITYKYYEINLKFNEFTLRPFCVIIVLDKEVHMGIQKRKKGKVGPKKRLKKNTLQIDHRARIASLDAVFRTLPRPAESQTSVAKNTQNTKRQRK